MPIRGVPTYYYYYYYYYYYHYYSIFNDVGGGGARSQDTLDPFCLHNILCLVYISNKMPQRKDQLYSGGSRPSDKGAPVIQTLR